MKRDDFDSICYRALINFHPIAISLESRKVYVGFVTDTLEPGEDSYITILPTFSGYRDPDTLEFNLDYSYDAVIGQLGEPDSQLIHYYMAFPRAKIWSLHLFNDHLYTSVRQQQSELANDQQN